MRIFTSWADAVLRDDGASGASSGGQSAANTSGTGATASGAAASAQDAGAAAGAAGPGAASAAGAQADAAAAAGTPGTPYRPEGIADNLFGASDKETMDNMAKALKGYREKDGTVPETAEAYKSFAQVDPAVKPYVDVMVADPLFNRMTEKAKEMGVPLQTFQNLTTQLITMGAEMGIYEPPIDVAAERAAMTPDASRHLPEPEQKAARERRMNDNFAWLDQQVAPPNTQGLSKEAVDFAKQMLGDRAVGHQFIEHFRGMLASKGPLTDGQRQQGTDAKAEIDRRMGLPENTWGHQQFNQASYDQLQKDARAIFNKD